MKKLFTFSVILILMSGYLVQGQPNKGNFLVGGNSNLLLDIGGEKYKTSSYESKYSTFEINFQPMAGYFFINNLAAGLFFDVNTYSYKDKDDDDKYTQTTFSMGPFARFYFLPCERVKPFAHGQVGFGFYKDKWSGSDPYKEGYFSAKVGAGADYFFNKHVAAEVLVGYCHETWNVKDSGGESRSSDNPSYNYNSFFIRLGVNVIIGDN